MAGDCKERRCGKTEQRRAPKKLTRARLLDSAQEIFARNYRAGPFVDQIAAHAEYSTGAVYSNFESMEAVFLELLEGQMSQETSELEKQTFLAKLASEFPLQGCIQQQTRLKWRPDR